MIKRLFDIVCAALGLLLLTPLLVAAALWVKLDSPGPALFRQTRVGRHGVPFTIHKFRTMRVAPGAAITVGADPRITRAGRWLRASKLDELPQLWDVLRGVMSLVGPRPELPHYVVLYPADLREQVLAVRPGITDPASLAFSQEAALLAEAADPEREYREVILPAKLKLSAAYAAKASLLTDLRVILRTLVRVVRS
ncbi:sugar transferase [Roseateles sp.]|uniref:sugar transferase n=1 Tax=Roseateles sp. TaxID=1971397 RepID=UPI00326710C5